MAQHSIEEALKQEQASLEKALAASPEWQRLNIIKKTLMELQNVAKPSSARNSAGQAQTQAPQFAPSGYKIANSIVQGAEFAIVDASHPLTTRELLEVLPRFGKVPKGKNPATNLSNNLSSDERFESVEWDGNKAWWLVGKRLPE